MLVWCLCLVNFVACLVNDVTEFILVVICGLLLLFYAGLVIYGLCVICLFVGWLFAVLWLVLFCLVLVWLLTCLVCIDCYCVYYFAFVAWLIAAGL